MKNIEKKGIAPPILFFMQRYNFAPRTTFLHVPNTLAYIPTSTKI